MNRIPLKRKAALRRKTKHQILRNWTPKKKGEDQCRVCGRRDYLSLHHIVPRSICTPEAKKDLRNGMTLCGGCHALFHAGVPLSRIFIRPDEWDYVSGLELTGRMGGAWLDKHYPETT